MYVKYMYLHVKHLFVISFNTGSEIFDQIVTVLLSTSMFVGGVTGFVLDNTVPGQFAISIKETTVRMCGENLDSQVKIKIYQKT